MESIGDDWEARAQGLGPSFFLWRRSAGPDRVLPVSVHGRLVRVVGMAHRLSCAFYTSRVALLLCRKQIRANLSRTERTRLW